MVECRDGCIDIDLDNSATCLWLVAIVAFLVGEGGENVGSESHCEQNFKIYHVYLEDLKEYKRNAVSAFLEEQIGVQRLESVCFRIKKKY